MTEDLSERLVESINSTYGVHPGHRAAHAKGVLGAGTFTPTAAASTLSRAAHFAGPQVRTHVRFSNGSGNPNTADGMRDARGMAVKFYLPDGSTADVIGLSLPVFFARTPEDLLAFNEARRPEPATGQPDAARVGAYLGDHPEAVAAVTAAITHPNPESYARLTYHSIHAYEFVAADGTARFGRYRFVPAAGESSISDDDAAARPPDYLREELTARLEQGPASFDIDVQIAADGDDVDDPSVQWAADREIMRIGGLDITALAFDRERDGDILVFDPTRVPDGIRLTDDKILLARPGAYSVSVARRTGTSQPQQ